MSRLPNNSDRDFSANQSEDDIHADIEELFASQPLDYFFADPIVQKKMGLLITEAMKRPTKPQRVHHRRSRRRASSQYVDWYFGWTARKRMQKT